LSGSPGRQDAGGGGGGVFPLHAPDCQFAAGSQLGLAAILGQAIRFHHEPMLTNCRTARCRAARWRFIAVTQVAEYLMTELNDTTISKSVTTCSKRRSIIWAFRKDDWTICGSGLRRPLKARGLNRSVEEGARRLEALGVVAIAQPVDAHAAVARRRMDEARSPM
jgi:hypothetical protein